jgi:glycosyltransferase involved in cell wall biosynthesis
MRITFILAHAGLAGGVRVVAIHAARLKAMGHDVTVVSTPRRIPTLQEKLKSAIRGRGWYRPPAVDESHLDGVDVRHHVIDRFRPVEDRDVPDADVVIATWWETAEWVNELSSCKGVKCYFVQHDERECHQPRDRVAATWRMTMRKICVAQWLTDLALSEFGDDTAITVANAVDLDQFHAPVRAKQPQPTVGVMYSSTAFKGCDISLKAVEIAQRNIPDLRLQSFGATTIAESLPLPRNSEYVRRPPQDNLKTIYARCDAWLFGSRIEGFGLPILEAMACRTPVIGTPAGAAPELLSQGGGILVKQEDPADMARAIERVCRMSEAQWQEMSQAAYQIASRYTWQDAAERFEQALESALSEHRQPALNMRTRL